MNLYNLASSLSPFASAITGITAGTLSATAFLPNDAGILETIVSSTAVNILGAGVGSKCGIKTYLTMFTASTFSTAYKSEHNFANSLKENYKQFTDLTSSAVLGLTTSIASFALAMKTPEKSVVRAIAAVFILPFGVNEVIRQIQNREFLNIKNLVTQISTATIDAFALVYLLKNSSKKPSND